MLARIEEDIDQDYEVEALKALWASYDGLTRDELLDFTGMPPVKWSEIQVALDENLFESSGQIIFGNSFIRKAVEDRHLPNVADKQAAHRRLGEWFEGRELNLDVARERLHQWQQSGDREKLRMSLLEPELLRVLSYHQACEFLPAVGEDQPPFSPVRSGPNAPSKPSRQKQIPSSNAPAARAP